MAGENAATATPTVQTSAPAIQPAANQVDPTSQASAASAPGTDQTQSQSKPLTAPLVKDPMALLNRFRERVGIKTGESAKPATPAVTQAEDATTSGKATIAASSSTDKVTPPQTAEAKPEPDDEFAARVAKFSRTEREFAQRQAAFEQEQARAKAEREEAAKQHEAKLKQAETMERAAKAIEAGDAAGALKALKADVNTSAFALQLLEQLQKEDERPMSQAEVQRIVEDRIKAENEARAKEEEGKRKSEEEKQRDAAVRTLEGARENYMQACSSLFSPEKHPFIAQHGLPREAVVSYAESQKDELGRVVPPDPEELLNHFETLYRTRAERAGWAPKAVEAPKTAPAPSLNPSSLVQDSGGRLTNPPNPQSLEAKREERKRRLRMLVK